MVRRKRASNAGFTLIELVVVIIVISMLILMALPQYTRMLERGKKAIAISKIDTIKKAEGIYFSVYDTYTDNANGELEAEVPEVPDLGVTTDGWQYTITPGTGELPFFKATATRVGGRYPSNTITYNSQDGKTHYSTGYDF